MPRIALPPQHFTTVTAAALPLAGWALHARRLHRRLDTARRDPLTGLYGRDAFTRAATRLIDRSPLALVVLVDLDDFKDLNDAMGHAAGDTVLARTAARLDGWATIGVAGRFGGDEFVAVLPLTGDADGWDSANEELADLHQSLTTPVPHDGDGLRVGASVGGYLATPDVPLSAALTAADTAMYAAKRGGGGPRLAPGGVPLGVGAAPRRWRRNRPDAVTGWAA